MIDLRVAIADWVCGTYRLTIWKKAVWLESVNVYPLVRIRVESLKRAERMMDCESLTHHARRLSVAAGCQCQACRVKRYVSNEGTVDNDHRIDFGNVSFEDALRDSLGLPPDTPQPIIVGEVSSLARRVKFAEMQMHGYCHNGVRRS